MRHIAVGNLKHGKRKLIFLSQNRCNTDAIGQKGRKSPTNASAAFFFQIAKNL
jgi:hypothetical protein